MDLGGAQVRYEDSENVIKEPIETPDQNVTSLFHKVSSEAIKEPLLTRSQSGPGMESFR